jgi:hypothetical protein
VPRVSLHLLRQTDALDAVDRDLFEHAAAHDRSEHDGVLCRYLSRRDQFMFRYYYINQERPEAVCRKLLIADRPATVFVTSFRNAQVAIETVANGFRMLLR